MLSLTSSLCCWLRLCWRRCVGCCVVKKRVQKKAMSVIAQKITAAGREKIQWLRFFIFGGMVIHRAEESGPHALVIGRVGLFSLCRQCVSSVPIGTIKKGMMLLVLPKILFPLSGPARNSSCSATTTSMLTLLTCVRHHRDCFEYASQVEWVLTFRSGQCGPTEIRQRYTNRTLLKTCVASEPNHIVAGRHVFFADVQTGAKDQIVFQLVSFDQNAPLSAKRNKSNMCSTCDTIDR